MLITKEEAQKRFEGQDAITCMPTGLARLIIPAFGFTGAVKTQRPDYLPPDYKQVMLDTEGLEFHNPKDDARQVLKKQDGCLICYEKPGDFCHRHRVAEWLNNSIPDLVDCREYIFNRKRNILKNEKGN